jgi:hypothetical protein
MSDKKWPWPAPPSKAPGKPRLVPVTWKIPRADHQALLAFAAQQNETRGDNPKVSMAMILVTLAKKASPELRKLSSQYGESMKHRRNPISVPPSD